MRQHYLAAQIRQGRKWKTVSSFKGAAKVAERWLRALLKKYRPTKPKMRIIKFIDDQPITPIPKTCSRWEKYAPCGGKIVKRRCQKCGCRW